MAAAVDAAVVVADYNKSNVIFNIDSSCSIAAKEIKHSCKIYTSV